jgi:hypothetical protein
MLFVTSVGLGIAIDSWQDYWREFHVRDVCSGRLVYVAQIIGFQQLQQQRHWWEGIHHQGHPSKATPAAMSVAAELLAAALLA